MGDEPNPYDAPSPLSEPSITSRTPGVYRYTELPRSCPSCQRKFSDALYHRLYRRTFRLGTIVFFIFLTIGGFLLMAFIGWLALLVAIPLGAWAMTWHKKVRVRCSECGWAQTFIVAVRG